MFSCVLNWASSQLKPPPQIPAQNHTEVQIQSFDLLLPKQSNLSHMMSQF